MLNITFKGEPFLFVGKSLDDDGAITTPEKYAHGLASVAHYYASDGGTIRRYGVDIGNRADLVVVGQAPKLAMSSVDMLSAIDNMLGGDPAWDGPTDNQEGASHEH